MVMWLNSGRRGMSAHTSFNFNAKVYRFKLPQATTIESSRRRVVVRGRVLGRKDVFLGGYTLDGCVYHGFVGGGGGELLSVHYVRFRGEYDQNKKGSKTPTTCKCIRQHNFTSFRQTTFENYTYCENKKYLQNNIF